MNWKLENETAAYGQSICVKGSATRINESVPSCEGWGFETRARRTITTELYDSVQANSNGPQPFWVKRGSKYAYLDSYGKAVTDFVFDDASQFGEHVALVKQGTSYFYINTSGKPVDSARFDEGTIATNDELLAVRKDRAWGYVSAQGVTVIAPQFEAIQEIRIGTTTTGIPAKRNGLWGLVDRDGKIVANFSFFSIDTPFPKDALAIGACLEKERCGFIGVNGQPKDPRIFKVATGPIFAESPGFGVEVDGSTISVSLPLK